MAKITSEQKEIMIGFLKTNKNILSGKTTPSFTNLDINKKWQELAALLNSAGGPKKSWVKWRKTWHDIQGRVKNKASQKARSRRQTGGGPPNEEKLSQFDQQILDYFIKPVAVEGDPDVRESSCTFTAEPQAESSRSNLSIIEPESVESFPEHNVPSTSAALNYDPVRELAHPEPAVPPNTATTLGNRGQKRKRTEKPREAYAEYLERKLELKKIYYEEKIQILKKQTDLMEEQVLINREMLELKRQKSY